MRRLSYKPFRAAARLASTGILAVATLVYAQDPGQNAPPPPPDSQQQNTAPGGGWPEAGSAQTPVPDQPSEPAAPPAAQTPAQPPQAPSPQQPPAAQQAPTPQPNPQYGQPPYAPYPQQQPYGQPQYGQPPYAQQPYGQPTYQGQVPAELTIQPGTYLPVRVNQRLASDRNQKGDAFTASLVQPLVVNGVVVAQPGQTLTGQVVEAQKVDGVSHLGLQLTDLALADGQRIPIQTQLVGRRGDKIDGRDAGTVVGSTALGAIIGGAVGYGTGAAIGAGAGALISLGAIMAHGHAAVIYPEQVLTFRVEQPVLVSTVNAPQAFHYVQPGEYDQPSYGPGPRGPAYATAAPPPGYYGGYGYPYPYYGYGYGYPYYWGPSVGVYFGHGFYRGGYYGRPYYGGHFVYGRR